MKIRATNCQPLVASLTFLLAQCGGRPTAGPVAVTVKVVYQKAALYRAMPQIALWQNHLVVNESFSDSMRIFDTATLRPLYTRSFAHPPGPVSIDPATGWMASCDDNGTRVLLQRLPNDYQGRMLKLPHLQNLSCVSARVVASDPDHLRIWVSDAGDSRMAQVDADTGDILQDFGGISGPLFFGLSGKYIFTQNSLTDGAHGAVSVPYVFRTDALGSPEKRELFFLVKNPKYQGTPSADPIESVETPVDAHDEPEVLVESKNLDAPATAAGDPEANFTHTRLRREYTNNIFVDAKTDSVFYVRPRDRMLLRFSASQPSEATMQEIPVKAPYPVNVSRYRDCLVVLGQSEDEKQRPRWSILKWQSAQQNPVEIAMSSELTDPLVSVLGNPFLQEIDQATGKIYLSASKGVFEVQGLFAGLDCGEETKAKRQKPRRKKS